MARYIDADLLKDEILSNAVRLNRPKDLCKETTLCVIDNAPTADVAEVKHGEWHILSDDPYDESGVPTEEGWYRIITADGQETTDYFFNKPTMCEHGITYWKNARSTIRAWAKMDGQKNDFKE